MENNFIKGKDKKNKKENEKDKQLKKIKNILTDGKPTTKEFDILYLIDATGSMGSYITSAKEESKNISEELKKKYPNMSFKYGYIFYRDPVDSKTDIHEMIDLTDNLDYITERISEIDAYGGGDYPEDWVGAYKMANEKVSWRNGIKLIIHLADAGAHGTLFSEGDKYPEEEYKLKEQLKKSAMKNIKIFGYVILEESRKSFNEAQKIYRNSGGTFEVFNFIDPNLEYENNSLMKDSFNMNMDRNMNSVNMDSMNYNMNIRDPIEDDMSYQMKNNCNFRNNALNAVYKNMEE